MGLHRNGEQLFKLTERKDDKVMTLAFKRSKG